VLSHGDSGGSVPAPPQAPPSWGRRALQTIRRYSLFVYGKDGRVLTGVQNKTAGPAVPVGLAQRLYNLGRRATAPAGRPRRRVSGREDLVSAAPHPGGPALSPAQEARLDALCDRFEDAWKAGLRPRLEEYLAELPEPERAAAASELLRIEA